MPELVINELLSYVFFMHKTERMQDISDVVDKYYSADAVADAKVALWQNYGVNGHDALPRWEDRRQTRTTKSVKDKELTDLLDGVKVIDQMYSDTPELPTRFVAVNLLNVPSCKPNGSNDADLTHRVSSLEQQMNKVLSMKLSYANVANPPAPMQNTPKRVVPGQSIPVTDPHYLPPGSLLRKEQPLVLSLDRSKSVEDAIDRTVHDLNDNPTGHDSTVSHDSVDNDNTPFTVYHKRRNHPNAVFGRKKNDKFKRGLQKHNIFIFNISSDVTL